MHLTRTYTTTAAAIVTKESKPASSPIAQEAPATTPNDGVDINRFDAQAIPADDDGPGAGGGYKPDQDPVEGPGAGGGYDGDEIPHDDDGPGAGGGYETEQEPAESDGPGAGGGYLAGQSTAFTFSSSWNQPLAVFSAGLQDLTAHTALEYPSHWLETLQIDSLSWSSIGTKVELNAKTTPKEGDTK